MNHVWENSKSRNGTRLVLLAIADNANEVGDAFPGIARIAKKCNMSDRGVQNAIHELERIGELLVFEGVGVKTASGRTNLYRVVMAGVRPELPRDANGQFVEPRVVKALRHDKGAKEVNTSSPLKGVNTFAPHGVNTSSPKPSENHQKNSTTKQRRATSRKALPVVAPELLESCRALINAWAQTMGYDGADIGASFDTSANLRAAETMLKWSTPVTEEEVRRTVILKRSNGKEYAFAFLQNDIPLMRAQKRLEVPQSKSVADLPAHYLMSTMLDAAAEDGE